MSMSERLSQNAAKINFTEDDDDIVVDPEEEEEKKAEEEEKPCQQPHWPLESVRNKVRWDD